ncbi:MAG TPA: methyltransferase domain-containing protein [Terracidiphilus sp.]|nr:methyltransferase domain-containing protein [Terracidiphilus sp.]
MPTNIRSSRISQIVAWVVASLFILGFFFSQVGAWTGPILGVWFVGTQRLRRGFLWMLAIAVVPSLIFGWRKIPLTGPEQALHYLGWFLLASVLVILPFTFHRFVSPRLSGWLCTLPLPIGAVALSAILRALHTTGLPLTGLHTFLILWFAATLIWLWTRESHATSIFYGAGFVLAGAFELTRTLRPAALHAPQYFSSIFCWICLGAALLLTIWALYHPLKHKSWAERPGTVALLQSPFTGEPLHVVSEQGCEALVSSSGERFPVRNGIPVFLKPEDLSGDNGKYNKLYETIGGFYDDTQRVFGAFKGLDRDAYFLVYMRKLEAKPGDSVLETSVGTGLSFKYLPRGVKLSGLDLSAEMLANCQVNLRRWKMEADLYLGNAESLPFADSSFDVVFHVGGISFFNDQAKAIREMIRVAKPGSLLLISDETEEYAKATYEKIPITSSFYKNRQTTVKIPIDLVPPEMQEIHLEMIKGGQFYAITFRKPVAVR